MNISGARIVDREREHPFHAIEADHGPSGRIR
jgi:hypothetical protein